MPTKTHPKPYLLLHAAVFILFLAAILFVTVRYWGTIAPLLMSREKLSRFLAAYGRFSALIYIGLQALHVVIAVIPGEILQIAGGYIFGTALGTLYSVAGILLGTIVTFYAVRFCGFSLVRMLIPEKQMERLTFLINNPKSDVAVFVLFMIPGAPKDALIYMAGLTPIKPLKFLLISAIARFPGLLGSAYIGANLQERNYLPVWIISAAAVILFFVGFLTKDRIIDWVHSLRTPRQQKR